MRRYTKLSGYTILLLLAALVMVTSSVAAVAPDRFERIQAAPAQASQGDDPAYGPGGPPIGPERSGETVRLEPLPISDDAAAANGTVVSDDFNTCGLDLDLWTFVNPLTDSSYDITGAFTNDAWLEISVPSEQAHDPWLAGNFAPRIVQSVDDTDFEIEVKFESRISKKFQMQGILVQATPTNFLRFEYYSDGEETWGFAVILEPGTTSPLTATTEYRQPLYSKWVVPLWMRVRRQGDLWTQYHSADGIYWETAANFVYDMPVTKVGLYAANAGKVAVPGHVGQFDYFFNTHSPIAPEDGEENSISMGIDGVGTVAKDPDQAVYACYDPVTLTPEPGMGWSFDSWTGRDAWKLQDNGDGTWDLVMDRGKVLMATFEAEAYTLTADTEGPGTLEIDPEQATYVYGDVVTLTPNPNPTFIFAKWLGPNKDDPVDNGDGTWSLTMDSSKELTALFTENEHTLTLGVVGSGTTTPAPGDHIYPHNDTATITVAPAAGWTFSEWLGADKDDLVYEGGSEWSLLMDSDKSVQARFRQAQYDIDITILGPGTVNKAPSPPYLYGDIVTLTPIPNSPAVGFASWGGPDVGDLIDNGNGTWRLMMDENKLLTATFGTFRVYVPLVMNSY